MIEINYKVDIEYIVQFTLSNETPSIKWLHNQVHVHIPLVIAMVMINLRFIPSMYTRREVKHMLIVLQHAN